MSVDLDAAVRFVTNHARLLDRRRLHHLLGETSTADVLAALDAYRNPDGGYGWGLEPDLRSATSQPVAAMHALEVLAEAPDADGRRAARLCDWLGGQTRADGGVPFALPYADTAGSAPHWIDADPTVSSLQMTAQLAAQAHRLARHDAAVAGHAWLAGATEYCLAAIERITEAPQAFELMFAMRFLDAAAESDPRARRQLERLAGFVITDGPTPVAGGSAGEVLYPIDFTPRAGTPARALFDKESIDADLERLAAGQETDGGWMIGFAPYSAAAALEWRGYATIQAVAVLRGAGLFAE